MRILSSKEKTFLRKLDKENYSRQFIISYLQGKLIDEILVFDFIQNKIHINLPQSKSIQEHLITQPQRIEIIEDEIIMIVNLLEILEKEGFIVLVKTRKNDIAIENILGAGILSQDCCLTLPDNEVCEYFITFLGKRIIPTQQFHDLIKHNFIPIEDRKYRRANIIAVIGILVAIILGVLPVFQSFYFSKTKIINNDLQNSSETNKSLPSLK